MSVASLFSSGFPGLPAGLAAGGGIIGKIRPKKKPFGDTRLGA